MCQVLILLQTTPRATGLCFQGRCCFDLADWPPLFSALTRTFSKTWEVKRSFMLTLLQLYHYECGPQLGSWGLALPARCHIGLLWDEPKYENPVGATGHSMVSLDLPTGLSSPYGLFTWCPPKRSLWSLPYRHVLRHLGKLLGLPNLELTCLFGKILSFIGLVWLPDANWGCPLVETPPALLGHKEKWTLK